MNPSKKLKTNAGPSTQVPSATGTTVVPDTSASGDQLGPTSDRPSNSTAPQLHPVRETNSPYAGPHYPDCDAEAKGASECGCTARLKSQLEKKDSSIAIAMSHGVKRPAPESVGSDTASAPESVGTDTTSAPESVATDRAPAPESVDTNTAPTSLPSTRQDTNNTNLFHNGTPVSELKHSGPSGAGQTPKHWVLWVARRKGIMFGCYWDMEQFTRLFSKARYRSFPDEAAAQKFFQQVIPKTPIPPTRHVAPGEEIISDEEFLATSTLHQDGNVQSSAASAAVHAPTAPSVPQSTAAPTSTTSTTPPTGAPTTPAPVASAPTVDAPTANAPTTSAPATATTSSVPATAPTATAPTAPASVTSTPTATAPHVPDQHVHAPAEPSNDPPVGQLVNNLQQSIRKPLSSEAKQQVLEQIAAVLA
ncbi:uncharacterized protein J4E78_010738 [Alternaria triticimaculans]|uniref:uncharacterized protein n=1 Tax=Alternaria triticimaculans TaxID=297637 RepID=UPI0020C57892|nr:uncharacterized protein J4E78_010738 [Alternaria triticimaculans]KAI4640153.1 hypothetical protein J4E78_010738 [Alternaria triticimaculans]